MTKIRILTFVGFFLLLIACSDSPKEMVTGTWVDITDLSAVHEFANDGQYKLRYNKQQVKNGMPEMIVGSWNVSEENVLEIDVNHIILIGKIEILEKKSMTLTWKNRELAGKLVKFIRK